jgi:protein-S-isoprenylcysteine O-methyltransferase Ste14
MNTANAHPETERSRPDQFGGRWGALSLTLLMPAITFYLWSAVAQHGGSLWLPRSTDELLAMIPAPTWEAAAVLGGWLALQALLYVFTPGRVVQGRPTEHGERAEYRLNGLLAFGASAALLVAGIAAGVVSPSFVLGQLGPLLTIAVLFAVVAAALTYAAGRRRAHLERSTGDPIYDFYMGTILNPRVGRHDVKFFFESRIGMGSWGALAILLPAAELQARGSLSTAMLVVSLCQLFYIVEFFVFEANLLSTIDIIEENLGFMLWFAFLAWMPFNFTLQQQYVLAARPDLPVVAAAALIVVNFAGYYVFRDANLQKLRFRRDPSRPIWGKTPVAMDTARGTKLLLSGWWGLARHANYFGDLTMALAWCLACGFGSLVPYFYFFYFAPLLLNRERRDNAMCRRKYGADWDRYCERVPYRIVPFVY